MITLLSGTAGAHLITIIALPFLQKYFFSEADFAIYSWYFEFILLFTSISALRLETGVVLETDDRNARILTNIALKFVLISSLIGLAIGLIGSFIFPTFKEILNTPLMFILIPISIISLGFIQVLSSWFTRNESFQFLAGNKIYQTSSATATQFLFGFNQWVSGGLIIGRTIGTTLVSIVLFSRYRKGNAVVSNTSKDEKKELIKKHRDFIYFTTPSTFLGTFINFIFIDLFIRYYGENITGSLAVSKQYIGMGLGLISHAFSQVFYSQIAKIDNPTELRSYYTYWLKRLTLVSLLVLSVVLVIPNNWPSELLGAKWMNMMPILKIITIWMCVMFISSSLSYIYIKLNRQKTLIIFDLIHLLLTIFSIIISYHLYHDFWISLYWFTVVKVCYYFFAIFATYYFFNHPVKSKKV